MALHGVVDPILSVERLKSSLTDTSSTLGWPSDSSCHRDSSVFLPSLPAPEREEEVASRTTRARRVVGVIPPAGKAARKRGLHLDHNHCGHVQSMVEKREPHRRLWPKRC